MPNLVVVKKNIVISVAVVNYFIVRKVEDMLTLLRKVEVKKVFLLEFLRVRKTGGLGFITKRTLELSKEKSSLNYFLVLEPKTNAIQMAYYPFRTKNAKVAANEISIKVKDKNSF